ncbi:hypothetical protein ON010_g7896 [Phytophthora cinnamomi]|nr:hypothetical protein ON010_g7896 [Phytophthora cinnamomi]
MAPTRPQDAAPHGASLLVNLALFGVLIAALSTKRPSGSAAQGSRKGWQANESAGSAETGRCGLKSIQALSVARLPSSPQTGCRVELTTAINAAPYARANPTYVCVAIGGKLRVLPPKPQREQRVTPLEIRAVPMPAQRAQHRATKKLQNTQHYKPDNFRVFLIRPSPFYGLRSVLVSVLAEIHLGVGKKVLSASPAAQSRAFRSSPFPISVSFADIPARTQERQRGRS